MIVVSTGFNAVTKHICLGSVKNQTVKAEHRYIEASEQSPPLTATENVYNAVQDLPKDEIVVFLDGDDWLAHRKVLEKVQAFHDAGAWMTYGSFMTSDGFKPDWQKPYKGDDVRRDAEGSVTHLRTFRAGLLQRVDPEDIKVEGKWPDLCVDLSLMWPIMEQAGHEKCLFVPDVLCVYHYASSFEAKTNDEGRARERAVEELVRAKRPYRKIKEL